MKKLLLGTALSAALFSTANANAADYVIDTDGAHAFVTFKIKHLGYSWLHGRFNTFSGDFSYDDKAPNASKINVTIEKINVVIIVFIFRNKYSGCEHFYNVNMCFWLIY